MVVSESTGGSPPNVICVVAVRALPFNCGSLMLALTFARKPGLAAVSVAALEI